MQPSRPPSWSLAAYRAHNDRLAAHLGVRAPSAFSRLIEAAQAHLARAERARDDRAQIRALHEAVNSLTLAVGHLGGALP